MPSLQQNFLTPQKIDIDALARIKHRLFVVGRFNRREVSPVKPPEVYLFTNRPENELSEAYKALFDKNFKLRFEDFIRALQPAIAEEVRPGRIPAVIQYMPSQDGSEEGSVVIDMWNFFFWRAIANSDQEAFKTGLSGAAREILREGEKDPGRGIYKLIRKNLNLLSSFQPRTAQLVEAFSRLLESCAGLPKHDLPPYAAGGALPGGFLEKLIDFVYSPDITADFSLEGIDLTEGVWEKLRKSDKAQRNLVRVVNTFRNALIDAADQCGDMKIIGNVTVYQKAKEVLAKRKDLMKEFGQSREAYNALSQIIRSKVLLSMVLEWVVNAHYDLEEVLAEEDADDKDMAVERLVLGKTHSHAVAEPVKRATTDERVRFKKMLADGFEKLVYAIIADDSSASGALAALSDEIRPIAEALRKDTDRRSLLHRMATASGDPKPFIESQKAILIDVLLPVLYQAPTMNLFELRELFRREVQTAYLTAVTLDDKYQGIVRQLGQEFLPTFLKNIDEKSRHITNAGAMGSDLLRRYVERIASRDIADRLIEAQETIKQAMTVLESTTIKPGESRGASHMSPFFREDVGAARKTHPAKRIKEAVGNLAAQTAQEIVKERVAEKVTVSEAASSNANAASLGQAAASGSDSSPSGGGSGTPGSSSGATADGAAPSAPAEQAPSDELRTDVRAMVQAFVASNPTKARADLMAAVKKQAEEDPKIVEKAQSAVRVFHNVLNVIYERYRENQGKLKFTGQVERMTLANLMLINQEALGLGKSCSNLYPMLLDVVENMDPENPNPKEFIRDFSLTKYFDNDVLEKEHHEKSGITELRQTLRGQAHDSLQNTVSFISELRGIKYLMDAVGKDSRVEIAVVNATADEFLNWLESDNVTGEGFTDAVTGQRKDPKQTFQPAFSTETQQANASPGLVYLTDSAFADGEEKEPWLQSLRGRTLVRGDLRVVLPPMCLSTGPVDNGGRWVTDGQSIARVAESDTDPLPAPVVIVGPSPYMNRPGDLFGTYLPAGYVFAAHFLSRPEQALRNSMVSAKDHGRFRIVHSGIGKMRDALDRALWGGDPNDTYAFAVDFYLYILLQVLATAQSTSTDIERRPRADDFFPFFTGHRNAGIQQDAWRTSSALDKALVGKATEFALEQDMTRQRLTSVCLQRGVALNIRDVRWFNQALEQLDLPRFQQGIRPE